MALGALALGHGWLWDEGELAWDLVGLFGMAAEIGEREALCPCWVPWGQLAQNRLRVGSGWAQGGRWIWAQSVRERRCVPVGANGVRWLRIDLGWAQG